ncbi:zf-HC2 domain-containing protein, partial [Streptomyces milbemycinicus]
MTLRRLTKRGGPTAAAWHVTPAHAASYADGSLPETDAWSVEKHVESCAACAERVSAAVRAGAAAPALADIRAAVLAFAEAGAEGEAAVGAAGAADTARHAGQAAARSAMAAGRADGLRGPAGIDGTAPAPARRDSGGALGPTPHGWATAGEGPQEAASLSGTAAAAPRSATTRPAAEARTPDVVTAHRAGPDASLPPTAARHGQEAAAPADSRARGPRRFRLRLRLGAVRG